MRSRVLPILLAVILSALIVTGIIYNINLKKNPTGSETSSRSGLTSSPIPAIPSSAGTGLPSPSGSATSGISGVTMDKKTTHTNPDLTVDSNGLSKATVVIHTTQGVIKYKFYPNDAPNTVKRMIELINQGFYNGLTFHRVVPSFVVQGGDPQGNGTGGSGQKLKAEFNNRPHNEGTVAMARALDPDSADSQFYICLGRQPHLDHSYTVFGQVVEGLDVIQKIKVGDKMNSVIIE